MRQQEFAELRVQREAVRAASDRQYEHRRWTVQCVTGRDLPGAGLQKILDPDRAAPLWCTQHREDASDREVHVDVGGAVERIEREQVIARRDIGVLGEPRILHFLRQHASHIAAPLQALKKLLVGQHVELVLGLALHVDRTGLAVQPGQNSVRHLARQRLAGQRNRQHHAVERSRRQRKAAPLLDQVLRQRDRLVQHGPLSPL